MHRLAEMAARRHRIHKRKQGGRIRRCSAGFAHLLRFIAKANPKRRGGSK